MAIEKVVDRSMNEFWQHYNTGHFDAGRQIVEGIGYDQEVVDFVFNPESYYTPTRHGETFSRPKNVSADLIPVIGLDGNESYGFESGSLLSLQEARLTATGLSLDSLKRTIEQRANFVRTSGRKTEQASVFVRGIGLDDSQFVSTKPILLLNYDTSKQEPAPTSPDIILHELVHLVQFLAQPIQRYDSQLQRELEAYSAQATLIHEYRGPYNTKSVRTAVTVDEIRRLYLGKNGYVPNSEFVSAFRRDESVGHIAVEPAELRDPV